jgi:hypothetical protein
MPDNLSARPLAADTLATDYISGAHHLRVKVQHGPDGAAADVSPASPLPVTLQPATGHTLSGSPPASQIVLAAATTYLGVEIRETTGSSPASVVLYDSATAASGTVLGTYSLSPGESRDVSCSRVAASGIYAAVTGAVQCTVFAGA